MQTSVRSRRLPGFRFEAQHLPLTEALPRMDVAVFVGFASSGPLHTPVAVEDFVRFADIFGDDAPVARDQERGEDVHAYLGPAVQSFFNNGGRRCWVIRVANEKKAKYNYFPVSGLLMAEFDDEGGLWQIKPAFARARSEGSWSDSLRVGSLLSSRPLSVEQMSFKERHAFDCLLQPPVNFGKGDLLRISFRAEGYVVMAYVDGVEFKETVTSPVGDFLYAEIRAKKTLWFRTGLPAQASPERVRIFGHETSKEVAVTDRPIIQENELFVLYLDVPLKDAPTPGAVIRVECGLEELWLTVRETAEEGREGSSQAEITKVTGEGLWRLKYAPHFALGSTPAVEALSFELLVFQGGEYPMRLKNLAFANDHPRFWGALPTDRMLYAPPADRMLYKDRVDISAADYPEIFSAAANPRFPLAGEEVRKEGVRKDVFYFPVGMPISPDLYIGPVRSEVADMERDGLSEFNENLFLDPGMIGAETMSLMSQADFLRYQGPIPRPLKGIHAALSIEEATVISVPDALHRGWYRGDKEEYPPRKESLPTFRPGWWRQLGCERALVEFGKRSKEYRVKEPPWENFLDCGTRVIGVPELSVDRPDETGTFTLRWSAISGAEYVVEETANPDIVGGAGGVYSVRGNSLVIYGRQHGDSYFRVRAGIEGVMGDWSDWLCIRVPGHERRHLNKVDDYSADTLLAVHRALVRMCAARGDLLAVLCLPEHYREDAALSYIEKLKSPYGSGTAVFPLGSGESSDFSYAAVYHPWLVVQRDDRAGVFRRIPPDGAACGVIAKRALTRGAWIAPANDLFGGVVALTQAIASEMRLSLQEAQINIIRREPQGFIALSADTLSVDEDIRPINVRRLMILLRRLALKHGTRYVFEPNDDSFRRLVQRGFEAMLEEMFFRGAFAGATPEMSYQVVVGSSINTPRSMEQGRFIVEIKVAPSLPMTFLTIRLVQTGDRISVTEAG